MPLMTLVAEGIRSVGDAPGFVKARPRRAHAGIGPVSRASPRLGRAGYPGQGLMTRVCGRRRRARSDALVCGTTVPEDPPSTTACGGARAQQHQSDQEEACERAEHRRAEEDAEGRAEAEALYLREHGYAASSK
jgi:hypothetical protein